MKSVCVSVSINTVGGKGVCVDRRLLNPSPKVPLTVNGREAIALADTGADMNVAPLSYIRELGLSLKDETMDVEMANGESVTAMGRVDLLVVLQERAMAIPFLVFQSLQCKNYDVILGSSGLAELGFMVDTRHGRLVPLPEEPEEPEVTSAMPELETPSWPLVSRKLIEQCRLAVGKI